jgi:MFS family permease
VPLALALPSISDRPEAGAPAAASRWQPSSINVLYFTLGLVDGLFTVTLSLLLAGSFGVQSALLGAGLLLASQRLVIAVMSGVGGVFVDRFGADRILAVGVGVVVVGLLGVAAGSLYPAAVVIMLARASLAPAGPVLVMRQRGGTRVERLAAFATWADTGAAAGPLIAGLLFGRVSVAVLYSGLAALLALGLAAYRRGARIDTRGAGA